MAKSGAKSQKPRTYTEHGEPTRCRSCSQDATEVRDSGLQIDKIFVYAVVVGLISFGGDVGALPEKLKLCD